MSCGSKTHMLTCGQALLFLSEVAHTPINIYSAAFV